MQQDDYIKINKANWNSRVPVHLNSEFYNVEDFLKGASSLQSMELELLGNIEGKTILHLQCHFGQDTISLARIGAEVTGVDFSEKAIETAKELAIKANVNAEFICCDVYSLPDLLDKRFDIVFTSYGVIGWLPDLEKWAYIISKYLNPGGHFIMVEFHPVVWMFDNDFTKIEYNYFRSEPIVESAESSYTGGEEKLEHQTSITWNHSLSEVISNLVQQGLQIRSFEEYDFSPYNCFEHTEEIQPGRFVIRHLGNKIPMAYSIKAVKAAHAKGSASRGV